MDNDTFYSLDKMDEIFEDFELQSIIVEGIEYKILLNDRVKRDLNNGKIALNAIECSLLNIPDSVFNQIGNEDFLFDCNETNMRLVLSKKERVLEVLIARSPEDFPIY